MDLARNVLLSLHLAAGLAALFLFWVPALSRKGSPIHRRAGRGYVNAMAIVTVSGFVLATLFLAGERWRSGLFLLFLGVITGTSLWNGWRVLRVKQAPAAYAGGAHLAVALANILTGAALIAFGIAMKAPLFYSFGPVGLIIGGAMLAHVLRPTRDSRYWLAEHFTGMIGSGIAAHVAFLVFGGRQLFGWDASGFGLVAWIAPLAVGVLAILVLNIRHRTRPVAPAAVIGRATPSM